jgi:outer membrane receptor protein involved in Fe transport
MSRLGVIASCSVLAIALAEPATAQGTATQASGPESATNGADGEIVVTAQKREQSINDVGLTIQAFGSEQIEKQRITTLSDVAAAVPGLTYAATAANTPVFTLRGVGFYDSTLAGYPTVSVYTDEIPLQFPAMTRHAAFDLERLEVLKGPQGTLFGQNSTGGAINYVTAKPTDSLEAGATLSYGRFNTMQAQGYVSGPLTSTLQARLAVDVLHGDDWQYSYTRKDKLGEAQYYAGRLLLNYEPASNVRILMNVNGWRDQSDPLAAQYILAQPQQPCCGNPAVLSYPTAPGKTRAADWSPNARPRADNTFWQAAVRGEIELTDTLTLTGISSYAQYRTDQVPEGDGQAFNNFDLIDQQGRIDTFTQEVRLSNGAAGGVRWVVGGNYEHSKVREDYLSNFRDSSTFPALGIFGSGFYSDQKLENVAAFGNVEFDIGSRFTLKGGLRYTDAKRNATNCTFDADNGASNAFFEGLALAISGTAVDLMAGDCYHFNPNNLPGEPFVQTLHEDNLSWRVGVDYKPTDDVLLYANVAKGYKAGSTPVNGAAVFAQYLAVNQESVLAYEAGMKATLLDRALSLNGAAFYYDYKDKQLRSKAIDPIFGLIEALVNIPKSRVWGLEMEATLRPTRGLSVTFATSYINAEVTEFTGVNSGGQSANFSGASVPYTPEWQASMIGDYEWSAGSVRPFVGGGVRTRSKTTSIVGGDDIFINGRQIYSIRGVPIVDLRAGVESEGGRWRAMVWGKNVFNEYVYDNVFAQSDVVVRYAGQPATYGITASFKY